MLRELLIILIWGFTLSLAADVIRRREPLWWIALILLLRPFGGIAYLLYLMYRKVPRFDVAQQARPRAHQSAPEQQPSSARVLSLDAADALEEQRRFEAAVVIYEAAAADNPGDPRTLHGLARCYMELERIPEALERYEALMNVDPRFRNYAAALEYAEALERAQRGSDAADLLEGMVRETGRLNHRLALAHYLELDGQTSRARLVLREALHAYERSSTPEQEANRRWQRRIADKLEELTVG